LEGEQEFLQQNFLIGFARGAWSIKLILAIIVAYHNKLECLPLQFTFSDQL
jgi:hypothetical protein